MKKKFFMFQISWEYENERTHLNLILIWPLLTICVIFKTLKLWSKINIFIEFIILWSLNFRRTTHFIGFSQNTLLSNKKSYFFKS